MDENPESTRALEEQREHFEERISRLEKEIKELKKDIRRPKETVAKQEGNVGSSRRITEAEKVNHLIELRETYDENTLLSHCGSVPEAYNYLLSSTVSEAESVTKAFDKFVKENGKDSYLKNKFLTVILNVSDN